MTFGCTCSRACSTNGPSFMTVEVGVALGPLSYCGGYNAYAEHKKVGGRLGGGGE